MQKFSSDIYNWPQERDIFQRGTVHNYTIKGLLLYDILLSWKSLTNARGLPSEVGRAKSDRRARWRGDRWLWAEEEGEGSDHRRRTDE